MQWDLLHKSLHMDVKILKDKVKEERGRVRPCEKRRFEGREWSIGKEG